MKRIMLILVLLIISFTCVENYARTNTFNGTYDNNWSNGSNWSAGLPQDGDSVIINHDCTIYSWSVDRFFLGFTINSGCTLTSNTSGTINIYLLSGNFTCNGTLAVRTGGVNLYFGYVGYPPQEINGSGTINLNKIGRYNGGGAVLIKSDVNLLNNGNVLEFLYPMYLYLTLEAGKTLNAPNGFISFDVTGSTGGFGTFDIKGTVNTKYIDVFTDNQHYGTYFDYVTYNVYGTGIVNLQELQSHNSYDKIALFNLQTGGKLYLTGATPFGTYSTTNTTITLTGDVHFSGADQAITNKLEYNNLFLEGSGVKTTTGVSIANNGTLTMGGTATATAAIIYGSACRLVYAGTSAQTTGPELTTVPSHFTINNAAGVTLYKDLVVDGSLTFTAGNLYTSSHAVTVPNIGSVITETPNHYLIGNLRQVAGDSPGAANYLGLVTASAMTGTGITFTRVTGSGIAVGDAHSINRYWTLSGTGITYAGKLTPHWYATESESMVMNNAIVFENYPSAPHWIFMTNEYGEAATLTGEVYSLTSQYNASLSGVTSAAYTVSDKDRPLPVELTTFAAKTNKNGVILNWETATEVSNHGFDVERALMNADGKLGEFAKLGFVNGNVNSNSPKSYSFVDSKAVYGQYIYRLKQIDTDGKFEYSKTVEVNVNNLPSTFVLDQNYPNPFNPSTVIKFSIPKEELVSLKVYDMLGREVSTLVNVIKSAGTYEITFNALGLSSGVYFYKLQTKNFSSSKKLVLIK